jgi:diacylglycerol kinase (ATP)
VIQAQAGAIGSTMRATLVHNPTSGAGKVSRDDLTRALCAAGVAAYYQSSKIGELTAVLALQTDLIIVAGGDGTVAKVLTQMPDRSIPVAILPIGTANNIASSFGIEGEIEEIAAGLRGAEKRRLDIGLARGPWGRCWFVEGIGVGALVRAAERLSKPEGTPAERLEAARRQIRKILKKAEPDRVRVELDDVPLPEEHLMLEILNVICGGPRLEMAPDIDPGDGMLDVIMVEPHQRKDMRRWLNDARPEGPAPVSRWRGRKIRMVWDGTPLHIDDDLPSAEEGAATIELELAPDPATILVPTR